MDSRLCLQLFLLLVSITPHMISGHDLYDIHKPSRFSFPQHLEGSRKGDKIEGINTIKRYLQRYGYIRNNNVETTNNNNNNVFDNNLQLAVKTYQKFFKLNVSGILDAKTLDEMSKPRCGVPDVFYNRTTEGAEGAIGTSYKFFPRKTKWSSGKYKLNYAFINNFPYHYKKAVNNAINMWAKRSKFRFREVGKNKGKYDIKISFEVGDHGDGSPFDPDVLAHAFEPEDGRLHFNGVIPWFDGARKDKYDVQSVALHEMGHILGLDHSQSRYAIMFPYIDSNQVKYLDNDDVDGLWKLYKGWKG